MTEPNPERADGWQPNKPATFRDPVWHIYVICGLGIALGVFMSGFGSGACS